MNHREQTFQISLVAHLRARLPKPWLVFACPNGGETPTARRHGIRKAMGVLAGVPDLWVVGPGAFTAAASQRLLYANERMLWPHIIAIECKAPPNRLRAGGMSKARANISPAQREMIAQLADCGVPTVIARELDETLAALVALGVPLKGRSL